MKPAMTSYHFRYADISGGTIRSTSMQCEGDAQAIHQALATMQDKYATLEVFQGDRLVYGGQADARITA